MKVAPHNQTLILASERAPSGRPQNTPGTASNVSSAVAPRDRVTIVAGRVDTTVVYIQADYDERSDRAAHSDYVADSRYAGPRDIYGNPLSTKRATGFASDLDPADRYARAQRILAEDTEEFAHIDVHA